MPDLKSPEMKEVRVSVNSSSSKQSKRKHKKTNPSIKVNGEKVIDSDIEEKKEERKSGSTHGKYLSVNQN
jgi:hypothetical protein